MARTMWFSTQKFRFSHVNSKNTSLSLTREKITVKFFFFFNCKSKFRCQGKRVFITQWKKEYEDGEAYLLSFQCHTAILTWNCLAAKAMQVFWRISLKAQGQEKRRRKVCFQKKFVGTVQRKLSNEWQSWSKYALKKEGNQTFRGCSLHFSG